MQSKQNQGPWFRLCHCASGHVIGIAWHYCVKRLNWSSLSLNTVPQKQSWLGLRSHTSLGTLLVLNNTWVFHLRSIFWFLLFLRFLRKNGKLYSINYINYTKFKLLSTSVYRNYRYIVSISIYRIRLVSAASISIFICPIAIAYSMGQVINRFASVSVSVCASVCEHSHGRISW